MPSRVVETKHARRSRCGVDHLITKGRLERRWASSARSAHALQAHATAARHEPQATRGELGLERRAYRIPFGRIEQSTWYWAPLSARSTSHIPRASDSAVDSCGYGSLDHRPRPDREEVLCVESMLLHDGLLLTRGPLVVFENTSISLNAYSAQEML